MLTIYFSLVRFLFFLSVIIYSFLWHFCSLWYNLFCCNSMMIIPGIFTISTIFLWHFGLFLIFFWKYYISWHKLLWILWNMYFINNSWHSIIDLTEDVPIHVFTTHVPRHIFLSLLMKHQLSFSWAVILLNVVLYVIDCSVFFVLQFINPVHLY